MHRDFPFLTAASSSGVPVVPGGPHPDFPVFDVGGNDEAAPSVHVLERQRDIARAEAAAAKRALDTLAERVFAKRNRKGAAAPKEIAPPRIDDLAREKARRALERGGFVANGKKR